MSVCVLHPSHRPPPVHALCPAALSLTGPTVPVTDTHTITPPPPRLCTVATVLARRWMHECMCVMQVYVAMTFVRFLHLKHLLMCVRVHVICRVCVTNLFVPAPTYVPVYMYVIRACIVYVCACVHNLLATHLCVLHAAILKHPVCVCVPHLCVVHVFVVHGACVNATLRVRPTCVQHAPVCVTPTALPHNTFCPCVCVASSVLTSCVGMCVP